MIPIVTPWTRLIRFISKETGIIHLGEPLDPNVDVGRAIANKEIVQAYEIVGRNALDPKAQLTSRILTVGLLLTPLAREDVPIVAAMGLNYHDHLEEAAFLAGKQRARIPGLPILFYKHEIQQPVTSLIPGGHPITVPRVAQPAEEHLPDWEVELAIVIGRAAKDVPEAEALDYVLGYTGTNDVSFRKLQMGIPQWCFSKGFDDTNPLGPAIVSKKAIPDPQVVDLKATLNGKTVQSSNTKHMIFGVAKIVAFLSQGTTLRPGMIILTGTPAGVGFVRKPKKFMKGGDQIDVEVGHGIGTLVNWVVEEKGAIPTRWAKL